MVFWDILSLKSMAPWSVIDISAAKSHLGRMVHMTQAFRFIMERAFLPEEEVVV